MGRELAVEASDAPPDNSTDPDVLEAAIAWRIKLRYNPADPAAWQAFDAWLQAASAHAQVWERLEAVGARLRPPISGVPAVMASTVLRQAELSKARRKTLMSLAALTGGGVLSWRLGETPVVQHMLADVATRRGERRRITLPDGGTLWLNTDTAVDLAFDAHMRRIDLRRGEIYLVSSTDAQNRPLFVQTRDGRAQALGTRYRVRQLDDASEVTVDQGAVGLWPRDLGGDRAQAVLQAGQMARMSRLNVAPMSSDIRLEASGWTDGTLAVRDLPLSAFLNELSRYHGAIDCDAAVASLPVSGVFQLDDTRKLLALLAKVLPIEIQAARQWWGAPITRVQARQAA